MFFVLALNIIVLSIDYLGMDPNLYKLLAIFDIIFTFLLLIEIICKIFAFQSLFLINWFDIFDFLLAVSNVIILIIEWN